MTEEELAVVGERRVTTGMRVALTVVSLPMVAWCLVRAVDAVRWISEADYSEFPDYSEALYLWDWIVLFEVMAVMVVGFAGLALTWTRHARRVPWMLIGAAVWEVVLWPLLVFPLVDRLVHYPWPAGFFDLGYYCEVYLRWHLGLRGNLLCGLFGVLVFLVALVGALIVLLVMRAPVRERPSGPAVRVPEGSYAVSAMGHTSGPYDAAGLQGLVGSGRLTPQTQVSFDGGGWFAAEEVPGLFAGPGEKQFTTALVLSILIGGWGVDRFYLGYTGLGIVKLLTCGGLGVWTIIDIILIATGKLPAADGTPLRR
ncbi:MAG: NINE protein [Aeromicrobium sp.]|uniref:NINE protein n=1 Tax=Aeromicrobium sp. TaxID=1871063 RepID=UPI0039E46F5F